LRVQRLSGCRTLNDTVLALVQSEKISKKKNPGKNYGIVSLPRKATVAGRLMAGLIWVRAKSPVGLTFESLNALFHKLCQPPQLHGRVCYTACPQDLLREQDLVYVHPQQFLAELGVEHPVSYRKYPICRFPNRVSEPPLEPSITQTGTEFSAPG
jgi:hypothetical protein